MQFEQMASGTMRDIVGACELPVIVLLLLCMVVVVAIVGTLIAEYFTEHRRFRVYLPKLLDQIEESPEGPAEVIKQSGLLLRQKRYLIELTRHPNLPDETRESLAVGLEYKERRRYDNVVKVTDVLSRVAPMLGLMGTLIPLGPGIMALGSGDVEQLSASLLTAFDTTCLGLIVAAFALIISAIRKSWYKDYMVTFDAITEALLQREKDGQPQGASSVSIANSVRV